MSLRPERNQVKRNVRSPRNLNVSALKDQRCQTVSTGRCTISRVHQTRRTFSVLFGIFQQGDKGAGPGAPLGRVCLQGSAFVHTAVNISFKKVHIQ